MGQIVRNGPWPRSFRESPTRRRETLAKALQPGDVAEAILAVAKLPARAVVPELQLMPTYL